MPTQVQGHLHIEARQNILGFGPWDFYDADSYTELFAVQIQLAGVTFGQIIGGVSPSLQAITTIQYLCILADQVIQVGLHGVNAQSAGFTLNTNRVMKIGTCTISSLSLYNVSIIPANVVIILGGM